MKIRAIEVEESGKVTRYTGSMGSMEVESTWAAPESFKYKAVVEGKKCGCGHLESEHLPECIYKVEGCECSGYAEGASAG